MAKNPPKGPGRIGAVKGRIQVYNPKIKRWVKMNIHTNLFMEQMAKKGVPFKGVIKK